MPVVVIFWRAWKSRPEVEGRLRAFQAPQMVVRGSDRAIFPGIGMHSARRIAIECMTTERPMPVPEGRGGFG